MPLLYIPVELTCAVDVFFPFFLLTLTGTGLIFFVFVVVLLKYFSFCLFWDYSDDVSSFQVLC